jgi:formate dehydrogenase subunit gamma
MVRRFSRGERWVHWVLAAQMGVLIATAAALYFAPLEQLVGRRHLVELVHVYTGFTLPLPLLVGWARSAALRRDTRRMNRFTPNDWAWLRSKERRSGAIPVGKFNAGQKLNGAFTVGAILVMLATGVLMYFTHLSPLNWRTGATFVHDWLALGVGVVVIGHLWFAAKDPHARLGMRTGKVPLGWARREHGEWAAQVDAEARRKERAKVPDSARPTP